MVLQLMVNGQLESVDVGPSMPVLWVLRDVLELTGTKYACGRGLCGTCIIHMDGQPAKSCIIPVVAAEGRSITTIEGLCDSYPSELHPCQVAWIDADVSQCGYCQPGQVMQAAALLRNNAKPSRAEVDAAMSGVLCRCGTYPRIRVAIDRAIELMEDEDARE